MTICTDWREHLYGTVTDGRMELNAAGRAVERVWQGLPEHYPHVELDVFVVMPNHVHGIVVLVGGESVGSSDSVPAVGSVIDGSRAEEAGYKPAPTQETGPARDRAAMHEAARAEEAGYKPAPAQETGPAQDRAAMHEAARAEKAGYKPAPTQETGPARDRAAMHEAARAEEAGYKPAPTKMGGTRRRHGLSEVVRGFKTYSGRRVNEVRGTPGVAVWQRGYYEHVVRNEEDMNRIRQYFQENPLRWSLKRENWGVEGRGSGDSG